jgi:hypothetical protein
VNRTFCLGDYLIVEPDLSVPEGGWKARTETVAILRPDGREFEAPAEISMSHINTRDLKVPIDQIWRVQILFRGMTKDDVPEGSKILVSRQTRDALNPPPLTSDRDQSNLFQDN